MRRLLRFIAVVSVSLLCSSTLLAETHVRLKATNRLGVPLHPAAGDARVSGRLPDGSIAKVLERDAATGWIEISGAGEQGWITKRYVAEEFEGAVAPQATYVIACWNLEHFHDGATRGFPEYKYGGPTYPARGQSDYDHIASIIQDLDLKIIALSEIFAKTVTVTDGEAEFQDERSPELERLIDAIDERHFDYVIGSAGGSQRLAILYDTGAVDLTASWEMNFPNIKVQGKGLFDRQPLVGHFRFKQGSSEKNDLAVVAVHLASGQFNNKNHDKAMEMIREEIAEARRQGWVIPEDENDIVIMGDYNANRFDDKEEVFWDDMEESGWDVLADRKEQYPPTRLSGHPLRLKGSRIDYIIITKGDAGLGGEEIDAAQAFVHEELIAGDAEEYRRRASDHLPVTVRVKVMADTDSLAVEAARPAGLVHRSIAPAALAGDGASLLDSATPIAPDLSGDALRDHLREHFKPTKHLNYRKAREAMFGTVDNSAGQVTLVYTGKLFATSSVPNPNVVNTEHTWPQSKFKRAASKSQLKSDLHHLYPTFNRVNGERSNNPFAEIQDSQTEKWWNTPEARTELPEESMRDEFSESTDRLFEPREAHKGNVARAMFYFATIYGDRGIDMEWFEPQRATLLQWHVADPVDDADRERSKRIEAAQGNRNPFVEDPSLAHRLFGN